MKIAVVGSMNMDMIVRADRIPLKGETIQGEDVDYQPGGKGANQAVAMARLGADVTMFGCVGKDAAGKQLVDNLENCGVHTEYIEYLEGIPTGQAMITVGGGDNSIVVIPGANEYVNEAYIHKYKEKILRSEIIVLQNEIPQKAIEDVIKMAYKHEKIIVWNPAPAKKADENLVDMVTYITPNEHEASLIWGKENSRDGGLLKKYPEKLIVTQGERGVTVCTKEGNLKTIPAVKAEAVDTTGAGDTLNGAFCFGLSKGMDVVSALEFANAAAGLSVQKSGAQAGMPTLEEVEDVLGTLVL